LYVQQYLNPCIKTTKNFTVGYELNLKENIGKTPEGSSGISKPKTKDVLCTAKYVICPVKSCGYTNYLMSTISATDSNEPSK
jgi:hypothetical protein